MEGSSKQKAASKDPLEAKFEEDLQRALALSMESAAMEKFKKNTKPQNNMNSSSGKKIYMGAYNTRRPWYNMKVCVCVSCIFYDILPQLAPL